jgi:signal transduction histidine kinase
MDNLVPKEKKRKKIFYFIIFLLIFISVVVIFYGLSILRNYQMLLFITFIIAVILIIVSILWLTFLHIVKKEIALREQLEVANTDKTNLIHVMNHQIKYYLTISKNIFAQLLTDDYGKIPRKAKDLIKEGLKNSDNGTVYVTTILKGSSAESGCLTYDMQLIDFKNLVSEVVLKEKTKAEKKGLKFDFITGKGNCNIVGDILHLGEAIGCISINLLFKNNKALFKIKDTGIGIKETDKARLFKAGGVGSDSMKINVNSCGYGLAFVKGIIEKHNGKVWFESEGQNKGATFFIELPVK